jgi:hypothetical protein
VLTILFFVDVSTFMLDPFAPVSSQIYYDRQELEHYLNDMQF